MMRTVVSNCAHGSSANLLLHSLSYSQLDRLLHAEPCDGLDGARLRLRDHGLGLLDGLLQLH